MLTQWSYVFLALIHRYDIAYRTLQWLRQNVNRSLILQKTPYTTPLCPLWEFMNLWNVIKHYDDVIMSTLASKITSLTVVYSTIYSGADQSKHQSSASLAFVWGIHRGPVNSPHKWPVTRKMFPFDDVIMRNGITEYHCNCIKWLMGCHFNRNWLCK